VRQSIDEWQLEGRRDPAQHPLPCIESIESRLLLSFSPPLSAFPLGSTGAEEAAAVAADDAGSAYVAGNFSGAVDFAPGRASYVLDARIGGGGFLAKYSARARLIWARQFIGGASTLARDSATGNLALALTTNGASQTIYTLDPSGNTIWNATLSVSGSATCSGLAFDAQQNLVAVGSVFDTIDLDPGPGRVRLTSMTLHNGGFTERMHSLDAWIVKLSSRGKYVWGGALAQGRGYEEARSVAIDAAGNIYTAGSFESRADFNPSTTASTTRTSAGGTDTFISKLMPSGQLTWTVAIGGPADDQARALAISANGAPIVTGYFQSTADLDPSAAVLPFKSAGRADVFVLSLKPDAHLNWAAAAGGKNSDLPTDLAIDPQTSAPIVSGTFSGTTDFAPGRAVFNVTSTGGSDDFLWHLSAAGKFVAAASVGGPTSADGPPSIAILPTQRALVLTSYFTTSIDADPGPATFTVRSAGKTDLLVDLLPIN
jgi:hypothetical protein